MLNSTQDPSKEELTKILEKCVFDHDSMLSEMSLRYLITEDISDSDLQTVLKAIQAAEKHLVVLAKLTKSLGLPSSTEFTNTKNFMNMLQQDLQKTKEDLANLSGVKGVFKSWWGENVTVSKYIENALFIQNEVENFCNAINYGLDRLMKYQLPAVTKGEEIDESKTITELVGEDKADGLKNELVKLIMGSLEKEKGIWARIKSFFTGSKKKFDFTKKYKYDEIVEEFASAIIKVSSIESLSSAKFVVNAPNKAATNIVTRATQEDAKASSQKTPQTPSGKQDEDEDEDEDEEEAPPERKSGTTPQSPKKLEDKDRDSLVKIRSELFPDEKDEKKQKKAFYQALKDADLVESRSRTLQKEEDMQFERWQKIAGIK